MILSGADGGQERAKMDGEYWPRCYYYKLHTRTHTLSLKAGAVVCIQWCYSDIQRLHDFRSTGHFLFFGGKSSSVNPRVGCDGGEKSQWTTTKLKNNNNKKKLCLAPTITFKVTSPSSIHHLRPVRACAYPVAALI